MFYMFFQSIFSKSLQLITDVSDFCKKFKPASKNMCVFVLFALSIQRWIAGYVLSQARSICELLWTNMQMDCSVLPHYIVAEDHGYDGNYINSMK